MNKENKSENATTLFLYFILQYDHIVKPNLYYNYAFPIDLASKANTFGDKLQSRFSLIKRN